MLKINEVRPTDTFSFRHSLPQEAHKAILEEKICQKIDQQALKFRPKFWKQYLKKCVPLTDYINKSTLTEIF